MLSIGIFVAESPSARLGVGARAGPGAGRRRHGSGHRQGPDRRRDAGRRGQTSATRSPASAGRRRPTRRASSSSAICRRIRITSRSSAQGFQHARTRRRRPQRRADHARSHAGAGRRRPAASRSSATRRICSSAIRRRTPTSIRASWRSCRSRSSAGLNQVITLASPGVVADSNGFFHPIGDHAQTQFSIDNQPVTDQQSRVYSNQISPDAVQSMEVITGVAPAEYGDKSSLVVHIVTKSGLDQPKPTGSVVVRLRIVQEPDGRGQHRRRLAHGRQLPVGQRAADRSLPRSAGVRRAARSRATASRSSTGSTPSRATASTFHLNVQAARSSFDVPNTFDQDDAGQDQHQKIDTFNVAPGYSQRDRLEDAVHGQRLRPAGPPDLHAERRSVRRSARRQCRQDRKLTNIGVKADVAYTRRRSQRQVRRHDQRDEAGRELHARPHRSVDVQRRRSSPGLQSGPLRAVRSDARRHAVRVQRADGDDQAAGGLRPGRHQGRQRHVQTRPAARSLRRPEHDDARCSRGSACPTPCRRAAPCCARRTAGRMETPYNENLLLSSGVGAGRTVRRRPAAAARQARQVRGRRPAGARPLGGGRLRLLHTSTPTTRYDFGVLFDTPIVFPDVLGPLEDRRLHRPHQSGRARRLQRVRRDGAHQRDLLAARHRRHPARSGRPATSGSTTIRSSTRPPTCSTTFDKPIGAWAALSWRYDSGLVAGAVPELSTTRSALTGDQQAAIGLFCGSTVATRDAPITSCASRSRRHAAGHSRRRHRGRREQSAAHRAAASVRPRLRRRQPVAQRQSQGARCASASST